MRIGIISDTLGDLPKVEGEFDLFIHAGNFAPMVQRDNHQIEITKQSQWMEDLFCSWFKNIKAKHKIFIPGQHDHVAHWFGRDLEKHVGAMYLQDEAATIEKTIIYGMPWCPPGTEQILSLEYPTIKEDAKPVNKKTNEDMEDILKAKVEPVFVSPGKRHYQTACRKIPKETQILISRIPPKGILDRYDLPKNADISVLKVTGESFLRVGDETLLEKVDDLPSLKAHIFGFANGSCSSSLLRKGVLFGNAHVQRTERGFGFQIIDL